MKLTKQQLRRIIKTGQLPVTSVSFDEDDVHESYVFAGILTKRQAIQRVVAEMNAVTEYLVEEADKETYEAIAESCDV